MLNQQFVFGGLPQQLADFLLSVTDSKIVLLLLIFINAALIFVGMIMNVATGILLVTSSASAGKSHRHESTVHFAAIIGGG